MRVEVDQSKCQGHNRCLVVAPSLFDLDDDLKSFPLTDRIPDDQVEAASAAVRNCPERAITFVD